MHFFQELAGKLRESDERLPDGMRKEGGSGSRKGQYLKSMYDGRGVTVPR